MFYPPSLSFQKHTCTLRAVVICFNQALKIQLLTGSDAPAGGWESVQGGGRWKRLWKLRMELGSIPVGWPHTANSHIILSWISETLLTNKITVLQVPTPRIMTLVTTWSHSQSQCLFSCSAKSEVTCCALGGLGELQISIHFPFGYRSFWILAWFP